jgi:hypothetical protein
MPASIDTTSRAALERLTREGWSLQDAHVGTHWFVTGTKGRFIINAIGGTQLQAWLEALKQDSILQWLLHIE